MTIPYDNPYGVSTRSHPISPVENPTRESMIWRSIISSGYPRSPRLGRSQVVLCASIECQVCGREAASFPWIRSTGHAMFTRYCRVENRNAVQASVACVYGGLFYAGMPLQSSHPILLVGGIPMDHRYKMEFVL